MSFDAEDRASKASVRGPSPAEVHTDGALVAGEHQP
jgi:hypothetical protein